MSALSGDAAMVVDLIQVDEVKIGRRYGRPSLYMGRHSGKELAQIDLAIRVADEDERQVQALLDKRTVTVSDPFAGRTYQATFAMEMSTTHSGCYGTDYKIRIQELDMPPSFEAIEIRGRRFNVLGSVEHDLSDGRIARRVLLRLSAEELEEARSALYADEPALVRRVGVDDAPMAVSFRGVNVWSRHEEDGEEPYFKQLVAFVPPEHPTQKPGSGLALSSEVQALQSMVVALTARVSRLVLELTKRGALSEELRREILEGDWVTLLDRDELSPIVYETTRVDDAAQHLGE